MSMFANLKGDKRADRETLADIRNVLGSSYDKREKEALNFGKVLYSVLRLNGKIRAAKPWDKLKHEEKLKWGGIAVVIHAGQIDGELTDAFGMSMSEGFRTMLNKLSDKGKDLFSKAVSGPDAPAYGMPQPIPMGDSEAGEMIESMINTIRDLKAAEKKEETLLS